MKLTLAALMALLACGDAVSQSAEPPTPPIDRPLTFSELGASHYEKGPDLYPLRAHYYEKEGKATVRCRVLPTGRLSDCTILEEKPAGWDFGSATVKAMSRFRFAPGPYGPNATIDFPMNWRLGN